MIEILLHISPGHYHLRTPLTTFLKDRKTMSPLFKKVGECFGCPERVGKSGKAFSQYRTIFECHAWPVGKLIMNFVDRGRDLPRSQIVQRCMYSIVQHGPCPRGMCPVILAKSNTESPSMNGLTQAKELQNAILVNSVCQEFQSTHRGSHPSNKEHSSSILPSTVDASDSSGMSSGTKSTILNSLPPRSM